MLIVRFIWHNLKKNCTWHLELAVLAPFKSWVFFFSFCDLLPSVSFQWHSDYDYKAPQKNVFLVSVLFSFYIYMCLPVRAEKVRHVCGCSLASATVSCMALCRHKRFEDCLATVASADEKPLHTARPSSPNSPRTGADRSLVVIDMTPAEPGFKLSKTDVADQKWDGGFHVCKQYRFA